MAPPALPSPPPPPPPPPGDEDRTRRNVACVNCRNSKVKCKASPSTGQPCQRCGKLRMACVVDRSHKRVTKRRQLEQLEEELRCIRRVVDHEGGSGASVLLKPTPTPVPTAGVRTEAPVPVPELVAGEDVGVVGDGAASERGPTRARMLGDVTISGPDVDWYFDRFLTCFHPFLPILRQSSADACYEANETLFWTVIYIASRRYARDPLLVPALAHHLGRQIWNMVASTPALDLDAVHALLLLCAWPLPSVRFVTDPSSMLAAVALNAASLLGCHVGRGAHPHFAVGMRRHLRATDEEASATWVACCVLAQRTTASIGIEPPAMRIADGRLRRLLGSSSRWTDLLALYEAQRFLNRLHAAMAVYLAADDADDDDEDEDALQVPESVVAMWEAEFDSVSPLLNRLDTEMSRFILLATRLEIQTYYFTSASPSKSPPSQTNTMRALNTSRSLITLANHLDTHPQLHLLKHSPQWTQRALLDASILSTAILHSLHPSTEADADANALVRQACAAIRRCSVREADLPHRIAIVLDAFWTVRRFVPPFAAPAPRAWGSRLAAGVTFWCLEAFRKGLVAAQGPCQDGVLVKALEVIQAGRSTLVSVDSPHAPAALDPLQEVDWSMFMDEFAWAGDGADMTTLP
ncbi:putative C6 transcription factor (Leu3) [Ophiocordyceps camponoti-floridani]|uniref:Putative C6 transcription factor (Leu3) n=1 Tax=Ophiocordyceps camponoti-floridani TaxID=2030778 RepID=A0A8H4VF14_9HYPO|nr:putative C6 transcription factor (Leu3) [Ophiocordyceps camponoti-floridani]